MLANKKPIILVVDDEKSVRELVCLNLKAADFDILEAENGRRAIEIAANLEISIDILLTDILMPQMNGCVLANRICSIRPFIKVLFMSAYTAEILSHHNLCPDGADLIKKPFTMETLMDRISSVWASSPRWKEIVSKQV